MFSCCTIMKRSLKRRHILLIVILLTTLTIYHHASDLYMKVKQNRRLPMDVSKSFSVPTMLPTCSTNKTGLVGRKDVNLTGCINKIIDVPDYGLQVGGSWKPLSCVTNETTAIIIPFRGRDQHLACLLHFLIPFIQRQELNFRIFVVEQAGNKTFNKGILMNAAFREANKIGNFSCFIFHDVDLIPENDMNMYTCTDMPHHMSIAIDKFNYKLIYNMLLGGVGSFRKDTFVRVNGYSNLYWGWGSEDNDMYARIHAARLKLIRPPSEVGRYKMIKHGKRYMIPQDIRNKVVRSVKKRYKTEGLISVNYTLSSIQEKRHFTHFMIDVGLPPKDIRAFVKHYF